MNNSQNLSRKQFLTLSRMDAIFIDIQAEMMGITRTALKKMGNKGQLNKEAIVEPFLSIMQENPEMFLR